MSDRIIRISKLLSRGLKSQADQIAVSLDPGNRAAAPAPAKYFKT